MKFKAFISYRHSENGRRHAMALETALKRYAKPTLTLPMKIFRDEKHMKPDINLSKLVRNGLENSECLIFLAEKASANSHWCCEELEIWCNPAILNRTENLIIILIDDDIVVNKTHCIDFEQTTALPDLLRNYLTSIPLYVDLRWAKTDTDTDLQHPKYRHEINALAARLRGVNPEDLNDEEIRVYRRNLRLRNGAIGVLLVMLLVVAGAAWWAYKQQGIAETNAREANMQRDIAEKQTDLANQNELKATEKSVEAEQNLTKAKAEEERARLALIETRKAKQEVELSFKKLKLEIDPKTKIFEMGLKDWERRNKCTLKDEEWKSRLDVLNLSSKSLFTLPEQLVECKNLTNLDLSRNNLSSLPPEIGALKNLMELDLSGNKLSSLPPEIEELKNLTTLNLGGNNLNILPSGVGKLKKLKKLVLFGNPYLDLPDAFTKISGSKNLTTLVLQNDLSNLPAEIGELKNLTTLVLSGNQFKSLPPEIGELKNLTTLDLSWNKLNSLPPEIGELKNLTTLVLSHNNLHGFPPEIGELKNLTTLDLMLNPLRSLPTEIGSLRNLKKLNLEYNDLLSGIEIEKIQKQLPKCKIVYSYKSVAMQYLQESNYQDAFDVYKKEVSDNIWNAQAWFDLSFCALFIDRPQEAISAAKKTIEINPDLLGVEANLALGYLLDNQWIESEKIYLKWKGKTFPKETRLCDTAFLQDIRDLEKAGILHPDFEKVKKIFGK